MTFNLTNDLCYGRGIANVFSNCKWSTIINAAVLKIVHEFPINAERKMYKYAKSKSKLPLDLNMYLRWNDIGGLIRILLKNV